MILSSLGMVIYPIKSMRDYRVSGIQTEGRQVSCSICYTGRERNLQTASLCIFHHSLLGYPLLFYIPALHSQDSEPNCSQPEWQCTSCHLPHPNPKMAPLILCRDQIIAKNFGHQSPDCKRQRRVRRDRIQGKKSDVLAPICGQIALGTGK